MEDDALMFCSKCSVNPSCHCCSKNQGRWWNDTSNLVVLVCMLTKKLSLCKQSESLVGTYSWRGQRLALVFPSFPLLSACPHHAGFYCSTTGTVTQTSIHIAKNTVSCTNGCCSWAMHSLTCQNYSTPCQSDGNYLFLSRLSSVRVYQTGVGSYFYLLGGLEENNIL